VQPFSGLGAVLLLMRQDDRKTKLKPQTTAEKITPFTWSGRTQTLDESARRRVVPSSDFALGLSCFGALAY
jgi:hypothetical protein